MSGIEGIRIDAKIAEGEMRAEGGYVEEKRWTIRDGDGGYV